MTVSSLCTLMLQLFVMRAPQASGGGESLGGLARPGVRTVGSQQRALASRDLIQGLGGQTTLNLAKPRGQGSPDSSSNSRFARASTRISADLVLGTGWFGRRPGQASAYLFLNTGSVRTGTETLAILRPPPAGFGMLFLATGTLNQILLLYVKSCVESWVCRWVVDRPGVRAVGSHRSGRVKTWLE